MGCDIHCYIEYTNEPDKSTTWRDFGGKINPGRYYGIFAKLAGVRNYHDTKPISEPRGLPAGLAYAARNDNQLYISKDFPNQEGNCSPENAKRWVESGSKYILDREGNPAWVTHPDFHSHSWVSADELELAINDSAGSNYLQEYKAMLAAMRSFESQGYCARLVFWFDN